MARAAGSTPPPRRVTRSQAQVETPRYQSSNAFAAKSANGQTGKGGSKDDRLGIVAEESPTKVDRATSKDETAVVLESPETQEGHSKLSGTTVFNQDSEDESEDGELNALSVVDELPDLQQAAAGFLKILVSGSADSKSILDAAKRLKDPKNTEKKRLKSHTKKLVDRMKQFGPQTFIDVDQIQRLVPTISSKHSDRPWSPLPVLHSANCARLALELLLATAGSESSNQIIRNLETQFPAPFMDRMADSSRSTSAGASAAEAATFELALEIRTQFFIMELSRRANEEGFDPASILRGVFYHDLALDDEELDPGSLRGFKLAGTFEDENGHLPDRFQDAVTDRFAELEAGLVDEDGLHNAKALAAAYPWTRVLVRTARFVHVREKEIKRDLQIQPDFDDIQAAIVRQIRLRDDPDSLSTPERRSSTTPQSREPLSQPPQTREDQSASREHISATPEPSRESGISVPGPSGTPARSVEQRTPVSNKKPPLAQGSPRRKSLKHRYLAQESMLRVGQRLGSRQQQDLSALESQPADGTAGEHNAAVPQLNDPSNSNPSGNREEVPESPQHNNASYADFADDATLQPQEELDLRGSVEESTSPPGSARINQVSHRGLFFDSPGKSRNQAAPSSQGALQKDQAHRRHILDRQNDARRVSPINSDVDSQETQRQRDQTKLVGSRKRPRSVSHSESSDDAFDRDERAGDDSKERLKARAAREERRVRQRTAASEDAEDQLRQTLAASQIRPSSQVVTSSQAAAHETRRAPITTAPLPNPAPLPASEPAPAARTLPLTAPTPQTAWAIQNAIPPHGSPPGVRLHVGRLRWTAEEDERLIHLIERWGPAWAKIESADALCPRENGGPKFRHRPNLQVKLKDRARNLKRMFLREGRDLPKHFDSVTG
ncbi:uncharacterized protein N7459_000538 [Penicillium hispanicum]|uniref:uncharacterized protein n=1 Tax=Penicillium hispanicum TaxID=1080232 RepID=UPI00253FCB3C|nr:uncharacterized protein N7459_000538 [Penicillium hispanicum]KAJ5594330.1 hypothetical protein N7459_000538 [Penicillium hispanicum]